MLCGRGGVAVLVLAWVVAVAAQSGGYEESDMAGGEDYADDVDYIDEEDPFWSELASRVRERIDTPGLLKARRWGNIANGILLGATGPVTLVVSLLSARLSNAILSVYLTGIGTLLAGLELNMSAGRGPRSGAILSPWSAGAVARTPTRPVAPNLQPARAQQPSVIQTRKAAARARTRAAERRARGAAIIPSLDSSASLAPAPPTPVPLTPASLS